MQPEEYKSSIAVIGCNKAANEYIAKAVANRLGMRYMDLDGYLKYIMGGISASKALIKSGPEFLLESMRSAYSQAAEFEGVVIASSALIFCTGADDIIKNCYTFIPHAVACEMCVLLSGGVEENVNAILKFLEDTANGSV